MKLKHLFCKHQWQWIGMDHTFGSDGFIKDIYFELKCKKCGKKFMTKNISKYEYEMGADPTNSKNLSEEWRNIFK